MRLTKQTGHAIRILSDCAHAGDALVKVAEISERLNITKQNVFKIVHILSRAGFVTALRGPNGGVKLARPAADIRIGDVVRAIEVTHMEVDGDDDGVGIGARDNGSINSLFDDALSAFVSVLDQHTLSELAAQQGPGQTSVQGAGARRTKAGKHTSTPAAKKAVAGRRA